MLFYLSQYKQFHSALIYWARGKNLRDEYPQMLASNLHARSHMDWGQSSGRPIRCNSGFDWWMTHFDIQSHQHPLSKLNTPTGQKSVMARYQYRK